SISIPSRRLLARPAEPHRKATAAQDVRSRPRELLQCNTAANQRGHETETQARFGHVSDGLTREIRNDDRAGTPERNRLSGLLLALLRDRRFEARFGRVGGRSFPRGHLLI